MKQYIVIDADIELIYGVYNSMEEAQANVSYTLLPSGREFHGAEIVYAID